uniref:Uncharacterized protein n=1 Tax=Triticum urartu TaxID=4572 RepID=A0A8R7UG54_TRIUA
MQKSTISSHACITRPMVTACPALCPEYHHQLTQSPRPPQNRHATAHAGQRLTPERCHPVSHTQGLDF